MFQVNHRLRYVENTLGKCLALKAFVHLVPAISEIVNRSADYVKLININTVTSNQIHDITVIAITTKKIILRIWLCTARTSGERLLSIYFLTQNLIHFFISPLSYLTGRGTSIHPHQPIPTFELVPWYTPSIDENGITMQLTNWNMESIPTNGMAFAFPWEPRSNESGSTINWAVSQQLPAFTWCKTQWIWLTLGMWCNLRFPSTSHAQLIHYATFFLLIY